MTKPIFTHACAFGLGALVAALLVIAAFSGPGSAPPTMAMASAESKDTAGLVARLTPPAQEFLTSHRDEFASRAGGPLERLAVKWGIPVCVREVPVILEHLLDELAAALHDWTMGDVLRWLESVAEKRGLGTPRAVREYRGQHGEIQTRDGALRAALP